MNSGSPPVPKPEPRRSLVGFDSFEVDVSEREVRKHGYKIKLQDQPFRLLEILLQHPGEVVTREELQRQIWPADTFVDFDRGLNNAVKRLREALGDSAENPRFVETLARRGYRFIAPTKQVEGNGHGLVGGRASTLTALPSTAAARLDLRRWTRVAALAAVCVLVLLVVAAQYWRSRLAERPEAKEMKPSRIVTSPLDNRVNYAAISPDGRQIAYTDGAGIHVKVIETGEARTILPPTANANSSRSASTAVPFPVTWYPDGTRLLVTTGTPRSTIERPTMWAISLVTGSAQKVYEGAWGSAVSPDGSLIAAVKNESEIWLMGPHGEEPRQFAVAAAGTEIGRVTWSPDSRNLMNLKVEDQPGSLECALEIRSVGDPQPRVLLSDKRLCYSQAQSSWWLPHGRIIFAFAEPRVALRDFNLWEIRVDPPSGKPIGRPSRLTNWPGSYLLGVTASADGSRLAFLRSDFQTTITAADLDPSRPGTLVRPHRLADEVDGDWPTAWTDDSRAVVFYTAKNGDNDIYEQSTEQGPAEPVITGPGEQISPVLSPDGLWWVYMDVPTFDSLGLPSPVKLMKAPVGGGPPQLILTSADYDAHQCSRRPSKLCVLSERTRDGRLVLSAFDPSGTSVSTNGKGAVLLTLDDPDRSRGWAISPDGSTILTAKYDETEIRFRFTSLHEAPESEVTLQNWTKLTSTHWAADGRTLFITSRSATGCTLLQMDLHGAVHVLSEQPGAFQMWAIPSPDGRHLAVFSASMTSEVWMAENF